jgi:thiol-disulfide isomerase/thioredoxin
LVVLSKDRYYEMVINEQNFTFESDTADFVGNFKTTSKENKLFYELQNFIKEKSREATAIQQTAKLRNDNVQTQISQKKIENIQKEIIDYKNSFLKVNNKTLVGTFIKATTEPELPTILPKRPDGRPDSSWLFYRYKERFFNNIDFSKDAITRTPFLQKSIDRYMQELTVQSPDSVIKEADFILNKAQANAEVFRYCLWYITSQYENSKIVGIDPVFIHLADKYYLSGKATWLDSAMLANFRSRVKILRPLQTGLVFPEFIGSDSTGREIKISDSKAKYTVVIFYADNCGHCKTEAPLAAKYYQKAKEQGVEIFMIDVLYNEKDWKNFINEFKVNDMVNLWDPKTRYIFKDDFDVYSTPTTYVLDENKRILGKRVPVEELGRYIEFQENRRKMKELEGAK